MGHVDFQLLFSHNIPFPHQRPHLWSPLHFQGEDQAWKSLTQRAGSSLTSLVPFPGWNERSPRHPVSTWPAPSPMDQKVQWSKPPPCRPLGPLDRAQPAIFPGWARQGWNKGQWPGLRFGCFLPDFLLHRYVDACFGQQQYMRF